MKATMDMTTGQWEKDLAPDVRFASDDLPLPREAHKMDPVAHAGLCEFAPLRPLYAGMPVEVATEDVDRLISRMEGARSALNSMPARGSKRLK